MSYFPNAELYEKMYSVLKELEEMNKKFMEDDLEDSAHRVELEGEMDRILQVGKDAR